MNINWKIKPFKELTTYELYNLLQLRSDVFIVEQNCAYPDVDGKDSKAIHVLGEYNNQLVAYSRIFRTLDYFEKASIGRVVVPKSYRDKKIGHELMKVSIKAIHELFGEKEITISAQLYLKEFYQSHGFKVTSEEYLEDDIPHIQMKRRD